MKIMKIQLLRQEHESSLYSFINLLENTCQRLKGIKLVPRETSYSYLVNPIFKYEQVFHKLLPKHYPKKVFNAILIGIDSSIKPIAESKHGYVYILCGAIVKEELPQGKKLIYRYGPLLCYLSGETALLFSRELGLSEKILKKMFLNYVLAKKFLISTFEYFLAKYAISSAENGSVVLIDGSLNKYMGKFNLYDTLLEGLRRRGIYLVGIAKRSRLFKLYSHVLANIVQSRVPVMIRLNDVPRRFACDNVEVYLGKLSKCGVPLRVDILRIAADGDVDSRSFVLDAIYSAAYSITGYPNVLRDAHITAKISKAEVLGLKVYLDNLGAQFVPSFKIRDVLFGLYNKGFP